MTWDYIVIGAGSAGCALTSELVQAGRTVLVIEAGGSDWSPYIKIPAAVRRAGNGHDWGYECQPDPSRNGAVEKWTRGRVLGGSSSINGTAFVRGTAADFDRWAMPGWSAKDVLPVFREYEKSDQHGSLRGRDGSLHVRTVKRPHSITEAFVQSAQAVGYPFNADYNGEHQEGIAYAQLSQRRGLRCSAANAFIKPISGAKNLKILLHARVDRVETDKKRAVAVRFEHGGKMHREVARDIVLCAGAINSPQLLMLSGIGDAEELARHNISVVANLPAVGHNLQEHPLVALMYRSRVPTSNLTEGLSQKIAMAARFVFRGDGPISDLFEAMAFIKSSAAKAFPDLQIIFMSRGFTKKPKGGFQLAPYPSLGIYVIASYPQSRGRIRLTSAESSDPPKIECRLLESQADVDTLVDGIGIVRQIMRSPPICDLMEDELAPGADIISRSALEQFVRTNAGISYHPVGTCRMGFDDNSVVGADLRVHGFENLWVADASVVPHTLSANMNAACIMIGKKLGKNLKLR